MSYLSTSFTVVIRTIVGDALRLLKTCYTTVLIFFMGIFRDVRIRSAFKGCENVEEHCFVQ